ncbi:hypothetical protein QAD02_019869 [Eretmocerus hayati]|uniref:Uncharacterized protein n=1 Tax=Eretmocerus hayati TaxID=131215 RepID=A0ACC2PKV3_9HYME|nr:hypothetical protein QAD02_019869 [Eretmocerus hayati]
MAPDRPVAEANESPPRLRIPTPLPKFRQEFSDDEFSGTDTRPDDQQELEAKLEAFEDPSLHDSEEIIIEEEVPLKSERSADDKGGSQSDDDLTSLSWLHQQNLLKGLELTEHHGVIKTVRVENILNNNIECEDSLDNSESTHSISSIESFSPGTCLQ